MGGQKGKGDSSVRESSEKRMEERGASEFEELQGNRR
jgi:hypothetical protein